MAKLKPWYQVIVPREDLREGKPLDAAEFAVHLDQVRDGRARKDYQDPERFFSRTLLSDRRASIQGGRIDEGVRAEIQKAFAAGPRVERVPCPEKSSEIQDLPALTSRPSGGAGGPQPRRRARPDRATGGEPARGPLAARHARK